MPMPRPAVNPLEDLFQLISAGYITKEIEFRGKKYTFRSLCDEDHTWRDQYVNMSSPVAYNASQRSPTLAIATVAIDGVAIEQMDELGAEASGIPKAARELIKDNEKFLIAHNLHEKVYSKLPRDYVRDLHALYVENFEKPAREVGTAEVKKS